jgi:hypothetical protein
MSELDRTIIKLGTLALALCALGVLGVDNPRAGRAAPAPMMLGLRRPPPCEPAQAGVHRPRVVAEMPTYRGNDERIVPIPNPCRPPADPRDADAALRRLREDLARIHVLRETAARR